MNHASSARPPAIGILSLDTRFARLPGDAGNPASYPFAAHVAVVEGADSPGIVRDGALPEPILRRFEAAAIGLEAQGAAAIVSTCGFLATAQTRIAAAVRVPVLLSALSLLPVVQASRPGLVGVLTASRQALGPAVLAAAGIAPEAVAIAGLEDEPAFADSFLAARDRQPAHFDRGAVEAAAVRRARALQAAHPNLGALLLECGNLPPYADALRAATGLPVFHIVDAAVVLVAAGGGQIRAM